MITEFHSNAALLKNYVLVSRMEWVSGDWEIMEWDCECGGPLPPVFNLPPPPKPPPLPDVYGILQDFGTDLTDCEFPWTCPVYHPGGGIHEDYRTASVEAPLAVVIISAVILLLLVLIPVIVICRMRCNKRSSKSCTDISGAIIYDDLPSAPSYVPARTRANSRLKPMNIRRDEAFSNHLGLHLYTPEPRSRPTSEHFYQSISSGSDTCSYSNSEVIHRNGHLMMPASPYQRPSSNLPNDDDDSEMEPLAPSNIGEDSDGTPVRTARYTPRQKLNHSPCHVPRQSPGYTPNRTPNRTPLHSPYCSPEHQRHPYHPSAPQRSPSPSDDSVYYVTSSLHGGRPMTPQERGLPPLPSRSDKFRIYFSTDRNLRMHNSSGKPRVPPPIRRSVSGLAQAKYGYGVPVRRWQSDANKHRMLHLPLSSRERSPQKQPEEEPLYENMP
ncbi:unnamed protein product [Meganyctiphanes norvegica]|uniref:Uncharacterized protein n=1 Tax=Meganyctiphanes norvegica TaxID=48144 RepID=A0AAV2S144_MEGNR